MISDKKIDSLYVIGTGNEIKGLWLYKPEKMFDSTGNFRSVDKWLLISKNITYVQYDEKHIIYRINGSSKYHLITDRDKDYGIYHTIKNRKQFDSYRKKFGLKDSADYVLYELNR